tara:strand:- start:255 stop:536 length:282 start_codon:yes stop_codon:yes gene_type:complete
MEEVRLIANPYLLANDKQKNNSNKNINFLEKFRILLREYYDIYLSEKSVEDIKIKIDYEINDILIHRIINECLDSCIEKVIEENKFDFCLPFD